MTIFFSPSANDGRGAFFDDRIFGPRKIEVVDEAAMAKASAKAAELDQAAFDRALEAAIASDAERPHPSDFRQHRSALKQVTKLVSNPDCRLPADAIEIDEELYRQLMDEQAAGKEIVAGVDGRPLARTRTRLPEEVLEAVRAQRDRELAATDWTQVPDAAKALGEAKRKAWAEHRQKLRDLPKTVAAALAAGIPPGVDEIAALMPKRPE